MMEEIAKAVHLIFANWWSILIFWTLSVISMRVRDIRDELRKRGPQ